MSDVEWESQQFCRWKLTLGAEFLKLRDCAYLLDEMHSLANHIGESFLKASISPSLFGSNTSFILLLVECLYGHANIYLLECGQMIQLPGSAALSKQMASPASRM